MKKIKKILIAEDSPTQALQLKMMFEKRDYEVLLSHNGKEAFELIDETDPPDIVISDIIMPIMDGYELCRSIKQNKKTRGIPVILLTQLSNPNDVIQGLQSGADNFISKPYSEEFLFGRINDILLNMEIRNKSTDIDIAMEIYFGGQKYKLNSNPSQILDLLLSTYDNAINKNKELKDKNVEFKKLHSELKLNNEQLEKSIEEKNQLLGIAAHDLRSPLCTVSSYIDFLDSKSSENTFEGQEQIMSTLNSQVNFMLDLVTDVLDFAKIESGKLELKKTKFDLISFMEKAIELNNLLGVKKNISILPEYTDHKIMIEADLNKLKQVLDNLFSNAMKFSDPHTFIHLDIISSEKEVQISVKDQGKGIPESELDNLFQAFGTTSVKSTAGEKSTGLGLVSVKKIVETHGGRIWVESEVGKGSEFHFTIPF
ncbi:MAG: hybrid sensor histidine kinase/response regulator [Bacteroidales bacterium]|nr:hybrid sensor histidine kinase/response regulator [Bacteroidales bacterium]